MPSSAMGAFIGQDAELTGTVVSWVGAWAGAPL